MSQQTNIFSSFGPASTSQPTRAIGGAAARSLSELPLPPTMQLKLSAAGFEVVADFDGVPPAELATDLGIELREAQKLLAQVRSSLEVGSRDLVTKSALQMLHEERETTYLSTFVKELDELLGGGVALRQLTGTLAAILNAPHASHAPTA
jgi:hypothetical protein